MFLKCGLQGDVNWGQMFYCTKCWQQKRVNPCNINHANDLQNCPIFPEDPEPPSWPPWQTHICTLGALAGRQKDVESRNPVRQNCKQSRHRVTPLVQQCTNVIIERKISKSYFRNVFWRLNPVTTENTAQTTKHLLLLARRLYIPQSIGRSKFIA